MNTDFYYKFVNPDTSLSAFVESIGMFHNPSDEPKEVVVMPDGRVDLFFSKTGSGPFRVMLIGLETAPEKRIVAPHTLNYVVSFRPLAVEYILRTSIAGILDTARDLDSHFWDFNETDLADFESFHKKASQTITTLLPQETEAKKLQLFSLIYSSNGEMSVKELSEKVFWSSRQINRYFNQQLGLSLKAYCNILRFRASLEHIAQGRLFPELNFTDQAHFIKEIKKFSGVVPKELSRNKNDRFILLSVLKQK
ncbi:helix-turn-helix domain-containing protein [Sediminibacterium ginsengisoli]|uniref:Helix-turn-helix domain-containing protein n=1 Tax=Sediminibacterium ginsengisoli TaxID=413434 RepID=A0A1T4RQW9_9BACT|nr:AraC family transcriptional regulator [Sediminibacterium ginsengisoli]SKA18332.1 Helix-turn-helix domain-containing protein [Sediminibacterium ginsengisoli]